MRNSRCGLLIGSVFAFAVLGMGYWAADTGAQTKPGESVVVIDSPAMAKQGPVEFSHPKHRAAFGEEKLDCKPCHMAKPPLFEMKKRAAGEQRAKMADMAQGKACGHCHDGKTQVKGKTVFGVTDEKACGNCHKKKG